MKFYETDRPKGVIIISHGFTEGAQKYDEMIYLFSEGWIPCVHARTYGSRFELSTDRGSITGTY